MYGMIHRAIFELVASQPHWATSEARFSSLVSDPAGMISTSVYPDEQTHDVIKEAAALMRIPVPEFLQRLGRFWITFSENGSYRHILEFTGTGMPSFVAGLDRMHEAVVSAMPQANVPSFSLIENLPGIMVVDYRSTRQGLEPFVIGLLHGLLDRFGHHGSVEMVGRVDQATRFLIRYGSAAHS